MELLTSQLEITPADYYSISSWLLLLTLGLATITYKYLTWHYGYWERQGLKVVKPWPVVGSFASPFKEKPMDVQDSEAYVKYGRIVGFYEGRYPTLHVGDPELIKDMLVKDFHVFQNRRTFDTDSKHDATKMLFMMQGDKWRALRNMITPAFTTGKMKQMVGLIEECAQQMIKRLSSAVVERGNVLEVKDPFSSYTLDVIATCAFGTKIDSVQDANSKFVQYAQKAFGDPPKIFFLFFVLPTALMKILARIAPTEVMDYLDNMARKVIESRKTGDNSRRDLLQLLLEAKNEYEKVLDEDADQDQKEKANLRRSVLTLDYISAQAVLFLLAGYETSSITLSFALYYLALNHDIQDKLKNEIDAIFVRKHNNVMTYEVLAEMEYLDMVISETLRICPPATRLERVCNKDDHQLGDVVLNKGDTITVPVHAMHHDPEFFPDPEKFDPERFSAENRKKRNPYTYLPFGYGPRNCIGLRFALMKIKIGLIYVFKEFEVDIVPETQVPFERKSKSVFLQPVSTILKLTKRNDVAKSIVS